MKGCRLDEHCDHLANINPKILLIVRPVANSQSQLLLLTGLVQLHLLKDKTRQDELICSKLGI